MSSVKERFVLRSVGCHLSRVTVQNSVEIKPSFENVLTCDGRKKRSLNMIDFYTSTQHLHDVITATYTATVSETACINGGILSITEQNATNLYQGWPHWYQRSSYRISHNGSLCNTFTVITGIPVAVSLTCHAKNKFLATAAANVFGKHWVRVPVLSMN